MKKILKIDKWKAIEMCDKNYDGIFYYSVLTTGIFCKLSCKSKLPLKKNVCFFKNREDAIKNGFRPCKRCRPDLIEYDPDKEFIEKIKVHIENNYSKEINLKLLASNFGISYSHLSKIFKIYENISLLDYIIKIRINNSLKSLKNQNLKIIDIAYDNGFQSLSNFYKCFKKQIKLTPREFRKK